MKRAPFVILLGSLLVASTALATTYVRVEKDGTKTYSDRPIPGGKPIEIEPAQTYSAPPPPADAGMTSEQQSVMQAAVFQYESCALTPRNDETFQNPDTVTVAVNLRPTLRGGDVVNLQLDGAALPGNGNATTVNVPELARGAHTATVDIKDRFGKTLCSADTTFYVMRPTVNSPARRPPPRPTPH